MVYVILLKGMCVEVKESQMNAVSSVSGCGLAFLFLAIEAMSDGGVRVGLPRALSTDLATQAFIGAARLVQETGKHPGQVDSACTHLQIRVWIFWKKIKIANKIGFCVSFLNRLCPDNSDRKRNRRVLALSGFCGAFDVPLGLIIIHLEKFPMLCFFTYQ